MIESGVEIEVACVEDFWCTNCGKPELEGSHPFSLPEMRPTPLVLLEAAGEEGP